MITINNLSMQFGGQWLFQHVDLQFTAGNCYGVIGANGAGKSTFLRLLSGELESTGGAIAIQPGARMSVLKQDQFAYDQYTVLETVIMGNKRLYDLGKEKDALYEKPDFSDEDGLRASELEAEFAELGGWEAESDASQILQGLGVPTALHQDRMADTDPRIKVKVLLAQALFGNPDIVMLDEPTNNLDIGSINWLEDFLLDFPGTVIVVSHDRHFLNTVCTHIVDIDYGKIKLYVGNYDFWYESSQLVQALLKNKNKRNQEKIEELQAFIARFAANKSKSKQATSRRKLLDKLTVEQIPCSTRRYPFVGLQPERELGKDVLTVKHISKTVDGVKLLDNVYFTLSRTDKVALVGDNELAQTTLFKILMEELEPDEGSIKWGISTTRSYLPKDNSPYFTGCDMALVDWVRQYSAKKDDVYLRGFLGRMLFSGEDVFKPVNVLSGGERVRCMLSKMMLSGANVVLLDQPTNHLDMESIQAVNKGLMAFPGVVLLASHDHELLQTVCNRVIAFQPDGTIIDRMGTYDEYLEWMKQQSEGKTNG
ncbi:MAG TPA: ATP-binding cassette domain-containing protein [Candidatus Faecousia faecigallinarum]|nr:ATP-binding cassette domain-containing protein [Candidatus Faecousia faecigallinarum]